MKVEYEFKFARTEMSIIRWLAICMFTLKERKKSARLSELLGLELHCIPLK